MVPAALPPEGTRLPTLLCDIRPRGAHLRERGFSPEGSGVMDAKRVLPLAVTRTERYLPRSYGHRAL